MLVTFESAKGKVIATVSTHDGEAVFSGEFKDMNSASTTVSRGLREGFPDATKK